MLVPREKPPLVPGKREHNKLDKLDRIRRAAREAFISKGYDEATTRNIARQAKVALGTLFTYATDKRDLLFLVINDDFETISKRAGASPRTDVLLLDNLILAFEPLYQFFSQNPVLTRLVLREMLFYQSGTQATRFAATRHHLIRIAVQLVRDAQARREIDTAQDPEVAGAVIFAVYQFEVRRWLARERLNVAHGLRDLKKALSIIIRGLAA